MEEPAVVYGVCAMNDAHKFDLHVVETPFNMAPARSS